MQGRMRGWLLIAAIVSALASWGVVYAQSETIHIVHDGETLTSIAQKYHTTVEALIAANKLKDGNSLYVGERLTIPGTSTQTTAPVSSAPGTYTVQAGDSLSRISDRYG